MLLLLFQTDEILYALDAHRIAGVVPRVALRTVPHAPGYLAGLLTYRGHAVPVIEFGVLVGGHPAPEALNSRVILTEFTGHDGVTRLVGIAAAGVNNVRNVESSQIAAPAMSLDEAPYLGTIVRLDEGLVQVVAVDKLLSGRMQDALYGNGTDPP